MRRITILFFCSVSFYFGFSQQAGKVKRAASNREQLEILAETNSAIYQNEMCQVIRKRDFRGEGNVSSMEIINLSNFF